MTRFSILDLAHVPEGGTPGEALANARAFARQAEALGFHRFWMAEHHNMPGIASSATAVALAHVAAATARIRIGAGGVMLPNHAPLIVAEQFGTLAALHPGRVDLGLGRAPGTDARTAMAMRRDLRQASELFPDDVVELMGFFLPPEPGQPIRAVPGAGEEVEIWILGSSLYGAQLAAHLGLPYAFASHFAPAALDAALELYRAHFRPSARLDRPQVMVAAGLVIGETEAEARFIASSWQQAFVNLRSGRPGLLPRPAEGYYESLPVQFRDLLDSVMSCALIGTADQVKAGLDRLIERTAADEVILTCPAHDFAARMRSLKAFAALAGLELAA
ncbi:MAG: LLM class flavin-dependent oxidoreductase [Alphaproteobacteria bacterium]|nr:MAG: LLM class flavin-dependent oxidoreductase [Alphaproteobacteria bacterium]